MGTDSVSQFESSLHGLAETVVRTSPDEFVDTLEALIETPAIGVTLPFDGVSLAETSVTIDPTVEELNDATTGVTPAGLGVASYGTVTLRSTDGLDELVSLYPPEHVVVLSAADIVPNMPAAFDRLETEFDAGQTTQILATGPSATGDMGSLVRGVHGPQQVSVVLLEEP